MCIHTHSYVVNAYIFKIYLKYDTNTYMCICTYKQMPLIMSYYLKYENMNKTNCFARMLEII